MDNSNMKAGTAKTESCTSVHACKGHDQAHKHSDSCGHQAVKHNDHMDYLVDGHLHHVHNGHCDNHGIKVA